MKRFYLQRNTDASGVSGVGKVAEGCQFDTGWCALVWLTGKAAMSFYPDIETLEGIHGHQGMTQIVWVDDESSNFIVEREQQGGPQGNRAQVIDRSVFLDGRRIPQPPVETLLDQLSDPRVELVGGKYQIVKEGTHVALGELVPLQDDFRPTGGEHKTK